MIIAQHPDAGFFRQFIYSEDNTKSGNGLDVVITKNCTISTEEGFKCEKCYTDEMYRMIAMKPSFLGLKKFFVYQMEIYEEPTEWINDFIRWVKHSDQKVSSGLRSLIVDVLKDIIEVEPTKPDVAPVVNISGGNNQVNLGGSNSMVINYQPIFDKMTSDGIPDEIIQEGIESLKDADKSDSLKKIAGNWIKSLPFKIIEKMGEWSIKNASKIQEYQDSFFTWFNSLS